MRLRRSSKLSAIWWCAEMILKVDMFADRLVETYEPIVAA
jgi:hypothetical protein